MPLTGLVVPLSRGNSMTHPPLLADPVGVHAPIWAALPSDLQQRAVRLLAQLAFAQFRYQAQPATQETDHAAAPQQPQDSA
jgi:hypothetical protein